MYVFLPEIRNPTGVTLGNYYEGFFKLYALTLDIHSIHEDTHSALLTSLHQPPFGGLIITSQVLMKYHPHDFWTVSPVDRDDEEFRRDCPTHLAMLDIWSGRFCECILFVLPYPWVDPLIDLCTGFLKWPSSAGYRCTPLISL